MGQAGQASRTVGEYVTVYFLLRDTCGTRIASHAAVAATKIQAQNLEKSFTSYTQVRVLQRSDTRSRHQEA